ncbi:TAT-variant-translocated molybdopterin oxidoreductase [Rubricoccus marinus]|uniref:4Fe-4S ferredoxin-type domain-containing protein n=1 Tax=Rubricoccus marinus TaxID=716817 RepID=A0A259TZW8_9BACT|nr:TAT-variant-translocated molybdopterin oxidoreductase [Rubricoccus marinus]OZC03240.1 hypothetical protein BSZ36_09790 [Rubricoccus marinus]
MIELDVLGAAEIAADDDAQAATGQPRQWRSSGDLNNAPGYAALRQREFLDGAVESPGGDAGPDRRTFLKVMGASVAIAGLTGCRRPVEEVLPYARKPENIIPGIANYYATSMPLGGVSHALLVQSHEGRPTKVEGNPEHPIAQGAADTFAYASVLNMYDPDRSKHVWREGAILEENGWDAFVAAMAQFRLQGTAAPLAILAEPDPSPTGARLRQQVEATFPGARWITLHPQGDDVRALGTQEAFGRPLRPLYRFSEADVIVSFDGDFLGAEDPNSVYNSREYAASRRVETREAAGRPAMSRMYVAESAYTTTGGMADHRLAFKASDVSLFAGAVATALGVSTGAPTIAVSQEAKAFAEALAEDVLASGGRAAFVAGATQPAEVHALCASLNARFGAQCVSYLDTGATPEAPVGPQLQRLVADMASGAVGAVIMLGTNPVYTLPAELNFEAALARVPLSVHVGQHRDETGQRATWHVPAAHYLESWGDGRSYDGTFSITQPLIAPLYADAHSTLEVLGALLTGRDVSGYDLVREAFADRVGGGAGTQAFENNWRTLLHDGFLPDTQFPTAGVSAGAMDLSGLRAAPEGGYELVTRVSPTLYDGLFSNNGWMQETPDPVTKVVWDNVAVMSAETAAALGVEAFIEKADIDADTVTIRANGAEVTLPVWIQPGHPNNSITAYLGYGREIATERVVKDRNIIARLFDKDVDVYTPGPLANGIGQRVEGLRSAGFFAVTPEAAVEKASGGDFPVVTTQDHGSMEGRAIVRMQEVEDYLEQPRPFDAEHLIEDTPWEEFPPLWGTENGASNQIMEREEGQLMYSEQQWGMTVDLNSCSGCNACVVACTSENNVPVVGKDQVGRGREMHWLRLDRYYVGDEKAPGMVMMPMMCQHCENAPCEQVCPVAATVHSPDGTNAMVYNRCIGTRYCANNCPYKVRRYNFYNWTKTLPLEVQMQQNPNVTVRYRGVMEKCSFCIHRVRRVQQYAHIEDRPLEDGEVLTACQQACPSDAIVFGDLKDPNSAVSQSKRNSRNYALLAELAVKPRLTYLARLRNPHPRLATPFDALEEGHHGGEAHEEAADGTHA